MEIIYLLEKYEALLRQVNSQHTLSNNKILEELTINDSDSYRIYKVTVNTDGKSKIKDVSKPFHSLHPNVQKLELKSYFHFNEFEQYVPEL